MYFSKQTNQSIIVLNPFKQFLHDILLTNSGWVHIVGCLCIVTKEGQEGHINKAMTSLKNLGYVNKQQSIIQRL